MSRVNKSIKNAKIGVFFFLISIIVHFFSRKIFLDFLGDEFIGLTSTMRSILGFLNLAELGIGTAIGYALYKPIFDDDQAEINKIIALLGIMYKKIGLIVLSLGFITSLFFPYFFGDIQFSLPLIYFMYFSFLVSSLLSYFINYHITLLESDQKGYVVQGYFQSLNIIRLILQSAIAFYYQSFYIWIALELFFSILFSLVIRIKVKQHYPWLILNSKEKSEILKQYPDVIKKVKQLFLHKMGSFVKDGTDNILVYALVSLQSVAFFGNYQLIFIKLTGLVKMAFEGTGAGIGNLVAENDRENINKVFWEMLSLQFFIGGFFSLCIYYLITPFIIVWIGEEYILTNSILLLMIANFFISQVRTPVEHFKNAYGLFSDTWAPAVEIIINLIISFVFGKMFGIVGIMLGTFLSLTIIVMFWKPYFLFKSGFKDSVWQYWKGFIPLLGVFTLSSFILNQIFSSFLVRNDITNFYSWFLYALKLSLIIAIIYSLALYIFIPSFRNFYSRIRVLIIKKFFND